MASEFSSYAVVVFTDLKTLTDEVNALLLRGWVPIGGITVSAQGSATYHYQAVGKLKG